MTLEWLLGWWNLIFVAPFVVALLYLGVTTLSGIGMGDADVHTDVDADADAHVEAGDAHVDVDADADADADVDADADSDVHADHDADAHGSSFHAMALSWLGVGRIPISLIIIVLLLTWGVAGFVTNAARHPASGWSAARLAVPVAAIASLLITRAIVLFMGRFVPLNQTFARPRRQLVGSVGEAVYRIDETFGMAAVRDEQGDLHQVSCRVGPGVTPIEKGRRAKLVAYDAGEQMFFVAPVDAQQQSHMP